MTTAPVPDWEEVEPGLAFAFHEARRLTRRARRRIALIGFIALLSAVGFVTRKATAPKKYEAQITFRIVEADFDLTKEVKPPREYLDYVWGVFLATPHLMKVVDHFKLYPEKYEKDPQLAIEALRGDLNVDVWRNYFMEDHYGDDNEARSVRVAITWTGKDPQLALDVVTALGHTILEGQTEERRQVFALGQEDVADAADAAVALLADARKENARRRLELQRARGVRETELEIRLRDLEKEEKELKKRVDELGQTKTRFDLTAQWERQRSGLRFELIDPGFITPQTGGGKLTLAVTGVSILIAAAFLLSLVAGAVESTVLQAADVRRLGMRVLGSVPSFRGDRVGNLAERLRAADRLK